MLRIGPRLASRQLVRLGEDDAKRHPALAQPIDKLAVDALLLVADVDEDKEVDELFALEDIARDHLLQAALRRLRARPLGVAIARKVHQIPLVVDNEVVDEQGLARLRRRLGQSLAVGEHIDQTRLATLDLPIKANSGLVSFGHILSRGEEIVYSAFFIIILRSIFI